MVQAKDLTILKIVLLKMRPTRLQPLSHYRHRMYAISCGIYKIKYTLIGMNQCHCIFFSFVFPKWGARVMPSTFFSASVSATHSHHRCLRHHLQNRHRQFTDEFLMVRYVILFSCRKQVQKCLTRFFPICHITNRGRPTTLCHI